MRWRYILPAPLSAPIHCTLSSFFFYISNTSPQAWRSSWMGGSTRAWTWAATTSDARCAESRWGSW